MNKNYILLNNKVNMKDKEGNYINLGLDRQAVKEFFLNNINQNTVFFHSLEEKLDYLVKEGYYDKKVLDKYTMEEIKEVFKLAYDKKIRFRSYTGAVTFYERYAMRTKDNERILERYEDRLSMIALTIGRNYEEAKEFINILANRQLQGATPIFMNAGKLIGGKLISCFLIEPTDDLEGIGYSQYASMKLSSFGGGVANNLSKLRARGDKIKGVENRSSGVLPVAKIYEDIFSYANQLGARSGAGVVTLNIFHPDIVEFINSKKVNADEKLRLKTLSTAISIPDKFMEILKDNSTKYYYTFSPKDVYDKYNKHLDDMNMTEMYDILSNDRDIKKYQLSKLDIIQEIIKSQRESGFSYLTFIDTMNKEHCLSNIGRINQSNLCVAPYTKILTKEYGYIEIEKVKNKEVHIWNGEEWSKVTVKKTGENQKLLRIKQNLGHYVDVTPYHKFYIQNKYKGEIIEKRAKDLKVGDKIIKYNLPNDFKESRFNQYANFENAYANGFFSADGTQENNYKRIVLCGIKRNLEPMFKNICKSVSYNEELNRTNINGCNVLKDKFYVPKNYNIKSIMEWLSGYADGDGHISLTQENKKRLMLYSTNYDFLLEILYLLQELGVYSTLIKKREDNRIDIIKGKEYVCKEIFCLQINGLNYLRLVELGFKTYKLDYKVNYIIDDFRQKKSMLIYQKITEIVELDGVYDTYCFTEPKRNMGMFNGMLLGNCQEIAQLNTYTEQSDKIFTKESKWGYDIQCVLSSLNLVNLFECKTDEERKNVIISSMKFLSNVSDLSNIEEIPTLKRANEDFHSVGLGMLGLHTLFVKLGIEYESEEAKDLTNLLFSYIRYYSLYSSMLIAKERGKFKYFEKSDYANGKALEKYYNGTIDLSVKTNKVKEILNKIDIYIPTKEDWKKLNNNIMENGLYNAYQLAIAPNQSSAYIMETSPSVQPVSSEVEVRDYGYLQTIYPMPYLTNENKYLYKSAYDVDQKKMLDLIRVMQEHIDQSISTTINIKSSTSMKEHLGLIIYAWKIGIKSLYYWRTQKQSIMADKEPICESCSV